MQDRPEERVPPEGDVGSRKGPEGIIVDLARKAVASSVSALLSSEEGLRALIGAIVPKEVGRYVANELAILRSDFLKALTLEISRFLDRVDPAVELQKALAGLKFDIHLIVGVSKNEPEADGAEGAAPPAKPVIEVRRRGGRPKGSAARRSAARRE